MQYKNFITSFGLFATIAVTIVGVGIFSYPQEIVSVINTDAWIMTLFAGFIVYILFYVVYSVIKLNGYNKFYIILKSNFGKILGGIFAVIFVAYNIITVSFGMRIFTEVVKMYLLEKTPTEIIFLITILTAVYLIRSGLESLIKFNEISFWIMFVPISLVLLFTLNKADFSNLLPVFNSTQPYKYVEALKSAIYTFSGIEIIYLIIPFIRTKSLIVKTSRKSIIFITLFYMIVVILSLSIFSKDQTKILLWPTITMIKSISVNGIFIERWEGVVMAIWVMFYFTTFSNIYYLSSDILKDMFSLNSIHIPSLILGIIIYITAIYPKNIAVLYSIGNKLIVPLFIFNIIILPIIMLILKKIKKSSLRKILPLFLICFLFTGCWDKTEIENKQLVSVVAIDPGKDIDEQKYLKDVKPNDPLTSIDLKKIHLTFGIPDLSQLGPNKGAEAQDKYIDSDGYSFQDAVSKARLKSSRSIRFSHTELLLFNEGIMKNSNVLKEILDYLQREPSLNRNMYIVLARGSAEQYIKLQTNMEKNMETYILGLIENDYNNSEIIPVTLNDFLVQMNENGNSLLPVISIDKNNKDIKIDGSVAIKNFREKGNLNPNQTANIELLKGKLKGSKKVIFLDKHPIDIDINNTNRKISVMESNGKLKFNVDLKIESQIKNYYLDKKVFSVQKLNYIQQNFNEAIKKECEYALKITQNNFQIDPVGFGEYLQKYHPSIWNKVKDNWDKEYKNCDINVNVDTEIRRIGVVQ